VAAHFLLGLAALDSARGETLRVGSEALFDRIANVGLGANVNYPPRYALLSYIRLLNRYEHAAARARLDRELERNYSAPARTPQEAALAVLAARAAGRQERPAWVTAILKQQRFDGSWPGQSFAVAPTRGWQTSVYSSTVLTTALCYDALAEVKERVSAQA
jgi:hypothetical protein